MHQSPWFCAPKNRFTTGVAAAVSVLTFSTVLAAAGPAPAVAAPMPSSGMAATTTPVTIEELAPIVSATSCEPVKRATLTKFGRALAKAYPHTGFTQRPTCASPAVAEQAQGRVLTWKVSSRSVAKRQQVNSWKAWLFATDEAGHPYAMARRLGIARMVWNDKEWRADAADTGWQVYSTCASKRSKADDLRCGRSGLQIVVGWAGALGTTSYWSGKVAAADFGPCRPADLSWAYGYTGARATPCPSYAALRAPAGATSADRALIASSGMRLRSGSRSDAVKAVQRALHVKASGRFTSKTRSAVRAFQRKHDLSVTSEVDVATWRALLTTTLSVPMTGSPTSSSPASPLPASTMPTTSAGSWRRLLSEDFVTAAPVGSFKTAVRDDWYLQPGHPYAKTLRTYPDGWGTTGNLSLNYPSKTADVVAQDMGARGVFRLRAHTDTVDGKRRSLAGSFFAVIDPNASGRAQVAQTYGRYSVRFRTVGGYRASGARYGSAFLLWPADDTWTDGEVDYPEMGWGKQIGGFVHRQGTPWENAAVLGTKSKTDDQWHVATIEWKPGSLVFWLDGKVIQTVTHDVPTKPFRWGFQSGGHDGTPDDGVEGTLLVDWITVDAWTGQR